MAKLMLVLLIGIWLGWILTHHIIAKECERLGGFFIGKNIYKCNAIEPRRPEVDDKQKDVDSG